MVGGLRGTKAADQVKTIEQQAAAEKLAMEERLAAEKTAMEERLLMADKATEAQLQNLQIMQRSLATAISCRDTKK